MNAKMIVRTAAVLIQTLVALSDFWSCTLRPTLTSFNCLIATDFSSRVPLSLFSDARKVVIAMAFSVDVSDRFIHTSWSHFLWQYNTKLRDISDKGHILEFN